MKLLENNMEKTLFIYAKNGKVKALCLADSRNQEDDLKKDGWKHTATLDACIFVEHICNDVPVSEFENVINSITQS